MCVNSDEADLLRLLTLNDSGGVYVDTDVLFVRPLVLGAGCVSALGIEHGDGGVSAHRAAQLTSVDEVEPLPSRAIVCNAILVSSVGSQSRLMARAVDTFVREYVPLTPGLSMLELHARGEWGAMGPLLLTRLLQCRPSPAEGTCVLERAAWYPISPPEAHAFFGPWDDARDAPTWESLKRKSVAVHLWNALTKATPLACGSLVHRLFEANCVVCTALPCV